jgi:flagellar hook-associated protein 3 FlgL
MRITTATAFETSVNNLQSRQQDLADSQNRLTSGKRVINASDDPVAAARGERALAAMVRSEADQRALEASRNVTTQTEAALGDATDLMQQARELVVNAGNGSYSDSDRQTLATSLKGIRDQLLAVSNRTDGAGTYLFGGQGTQAPPFVDAPGGVVYQGAGGQTTVQSSEALPMTVDGGQTWLQTPNPTAGGPPLSVFNTLDSIISDLNTPGRGGDQIKQTVTTGLSNIDAVTGSLTSARAAAGSTLNRQDTIESRISATKLAAQTERSNATDLDMVQAISDFQNKQSGYDAALKTYSTVQHLSLFQYISA